MTLKLCSTCTLPKHVFFCYSKCGYFIYSKQIAMRLGPVFFLHTHTRTHPHHVAPEGYFKDSIYMGACPPLRATSCWRLFSQTEEQFLNVWNLIKHASFGLGCVFCAWLPVTFARCWNVLPLAISAMETEDTLLDEGRRLVLLGAVLLFAYKKGWGKDFVIPESWGPFLNCFFFSSFFLLLLCWYDDTYCKPARKTLQGSKCQAV